MIMALSNSKGGVGKSTIAVHLAVWLAEQGHHVVLVDSDVQASSSTWLQEAEPRIKSVRLLTADDVINQLPALAAEYDYVVADGPAGLNEVTRALMFIADLAIFPCGPSALDLRAVIDAITVLNQIKKHRGGKPDAIIIPNKLQPQYRLSKELMQTVHGLGMPSGDGLGLRQAYADAAGQGSVVWRMDTSSARDASAEMQFLFQQLTAYEART
jgi:chromosome partitioning protein